MQRCSKTLFSINPVFASSCRLRRTYAIAEVSQSPPDPSSTRFEQFLRKNDSRNLPENELSSLVYEMKSSDHWPVSDPTQVNLVIAFLYKNNYFDPIMHYYRLLKNAKCVSLLDSHSLCAIVAAMGSKGDKGGAIALLAAVSSRAIARTIWKPFLVQAVRANDRGLAFSFVQALTRSNVILNPEDYAWIMRRLAGDLQYVFAVWRLVEEKHGTLTPLILYESLLVAIVKEGKLVIDAQRLLTQVREERMRHMFAGKEFENAGSKLRAILRKFSETGSPVIFARALGPNSEFHSAPLKDFSNKALAVSMYLRGSAGLQAGSTAVICVGHKPLEIASEFGVVMSGLRFRILDPNVSALNKLKDSSVTCALVSESQLPRFQRALAHRLDAFDLIVMDDDGGKFHRKNRVLSSGNIRTISISSLLRKPVNEGGLSEYSMSREDVIATFDGDKEMLDWQYQISLDWRIASTRKRENADSTDKLKLKFQEFLNEFQRIGEGGWKEWDIE